MFKLSNEINELLDYFRLNSEEQRFLFSLQYHLVSLDIQNTVDRSVKQTKEAWLSRWAAGINSSQEANVVTDETELYKGLKEIRQEKLCLPKLGAILMETYLFTPYYPLDGEKEKTKLPYDEGLKLEQIKFFCRELAFSNGLLMKACEAYTTALKEIPPSGFLKKALLAIGAAILFAITGGVAAPVIGAAIGGAMGLAGAAATSAGLAFLGGGAIAAGGLGMAGGTAVIIGGGSVLGAGLGAVGSKLLFTVAKDKNLILSQLAKMEAIAKTLIITIDEHEELIKQIIKDQEKSMEALRKEAKKDKEFEVCVEYYEEAIKRLNEFCAATV